MKRRGLNIIIFFEISFLLLTQASPTSEPFYLIAHMANSQAAIDWAVSQGANGIESDLHFDDDGNPTIFVHGGWCDCNCIDTSDSTCNRGLDGACGGPEASDDAAVHMRYIASYSSIAFFYVDSKVDPSWGSRLDKAGAAVIPFIDDNLFNYGYKGKVLISAARISTYNYIQAAVIAANDSVNKDNYFFTFDEQGHDYKGVMAMLSRLTNNRVYSTGISSCLPNLYDSAIEASVNGIDIGENGLSIIWTIDYSTSMINYINLGVNGLLTDRIPTGRRVVNSMGLTLASPSTPIPVSTVNVASPKKCNCDYHNGGCMISWPAPSGKACDCTAKMHRTLNTCVGSLVSCDVSQPKCANPDESEEACRLGGGNCDGY